MVQPDPLQPIAALPPQLARADVAAAVADRYGLTGTFESLVSERDQNFRLTATDGWQYVVKIANRQEPPITTAFQIAALLHIESKGCPVPVPAIIKTERGDPATSIAADDGSYSLRIVSYLPGVPMKDAPPTAGLAAALGQALARLDGALAEFAHEGDRQVLLWDIQRAPYLRSLVPHNPDPDLSRLVVDCLDVFESEALPRFPELRGQVIHNDINPGNVLVSDDESQQIAGIIDFGDMVRAPLIVDVAVACAYLRTRGSDPLEFIAPFVAAYDAVCGLDDIELELLFDLVRTRLVTTVTIMYWRMAMRDSEDSYTREAFVDEHASSGFLQSLTALGKSAFDERIRRACGV